MKQDKEPHAAQVRGLATPAIVDKTISMSNNKYVNLMNMTHHITAQHRLRPSTFCIVEELLKQGSQSFFINFLGYSGEFRRFLRRFIGSFADSREIR